MNVTCPRCGARQEVQSETRFYTCSYCRSTFALEGGVRVAEYLADSRPDERSAWSVLVDHLEQGGHRSAIQRHRCGTIVCPFWLVRTNDGGTLFRPAATVDVPLLESVTLPGCDLIPLSDSPSPALPDHPLETVLEAARLSAGECQVSLVHLPLQVLEYGVDGVDYCCTVMVADWKLYAQLLPPLESAGIPLPRICFLAAYAALLLVAGMAIRHPLVRGAVFSLLLAAAWLLGRRMIAAEVPS
jgi:hypothetical protein